MVRTKTFDCVEMKNKIQADILRRRKPGPAAVASAKKLTAFARKLKKLAIY